MKRNIYYLLIGVVAILIVVLFWWATEIHSPLPVWIGILGGIAFLYFAKKQVTDIVEDELAAKITEKSALRTLQVFWVVFFAFSAGAILDLLRPPPFKEPFWIKMRPEPPLDVFPLRFVGYLQLGMLCLMIFLYIGFRIYYSKKYGVWDSDEEQD